MKCDGVSTALVSREEEPAHGSVSWSQFDTASSVRDSLQKMFETTTTCPTTHDHLEDALGLLMTSTSADDEASSQPIERSVFEEAFSGVINVKDHLGFLLLAPIGSEASLRRRVSGGRLRAVWICLLFFLGCYRWFGPE